MGVQLCFQACAAHQCFRLLLARDIETFQCFGVGNSFVFVLSGEQVESDARIGHTPGRIDAWGEGEGDIALTNLPRLNIGLFD